MPECVVVAGAMAQRPERAGHAWVFVNWLLGFRRLGYDVLFVDRMDSALGDVDRGCAWVQDVMTAEGLDDAWSVLLDGGRSVGLSRADVAEHLRDSVLLNVMGYLHDDDLLALAACRVFLDIDPGFPQTWHHLGLADLLAGHDAYATVGLNIGRHDCLVPDVGIPWVTTVPPVALDSWATSSEPGTRFTSIGSWRGPFGALDVDGRTFGLRVHTARGYADLPTRAGAPLEIALDIDGADGADRARLVAGGWLLSDPRVVSQDLATYRSYVHDSLGEFGIAKQAYVEMRSGWFSDRSACYLASGRPVVVTDTALAPHLPVGEGLLIYSTFVEAVEALAAVTADGARHAKAARRLAEDLFDAPTVARQLLDRVV